MLLTAPPVETIRWRDARLRAAYAALGLALVASIFFLPRTFLSGDEYLYAGEARMLLHGRLLPIDGDAIPFVVDTPSLPIRYPLGWPALLALGAPLGMRAMAFVTVLAHLAGGAAFARILVRRGLPSWVACVYLFHPVFWSFSRTLMSDVPTAALVVVAVDAWENRRASMTALGLGYAIFMRIASVTLAVGFGIATLGEIRSRFRALLVVAAGCALGFGGVLVVNQLTHGHPFSSAYTKNAGSLFGAQMFGENLLLYGAGLLLVPPFPLLCLVLRARACDRWVFAALPTLVFFLFYAYHDRAASLPEQLVVGQRLVLPVHALFLIATARVWGGLRVLRWRSAVLAVGLVAGVAQAWVVSRAYRRFEPAYAALRDVGAKRIAYSEEAARVALAVPAEAHYSIDKRDPPADADAAIVAMRQPSNQGVQAVSYRLTPGLVGRIDRCRQVGEFFLFDFSARELAGNPCKLEGDQPSDK